MKRRALLAGIFGAFAAASIALPSFANPASWDYIGSRRVNWLVDHDTLHVGLLQGGFEKLRIRVRGNGLFMYNLKVVYHNGGVQNVPLRFHFQQGTHSRVVSLAGVNNRIIRRIEMSYGKPFNGNGPTWVDVYAKH